MHYVHQFKSSSIPFGQGAIDFSFIIDFDFNIDIDIDTDMENNAQFNKVSDKLVKLPLSSSSSSSYEKMLLMSTVAREASG